VTPTAIIALLRDIVIVGAIGFIVYVLITYGKDVVKIADMKAVQEQITKNAETTAQWQKEATDANTKRDADLAAVAATISSHRDPVYIVRDRPTSAGTVSANTGQASGQASGAGGTDAGVRSDRQRVDIRPEINAYELKYETALVDCYAGLDKWPVQP
jgi:predicted metalloprotease